MPSTAPLRDLVAETATRLGPDAPTLCDPWTVQDLLAHLVVRESRVDALPGIGLGSTVLGRHTRAVQADAAQRPLAELANEVLAGPAAWFPTRVQALDVLVNTAELAIHLEDMVRAQPGWVPTEHDAPTMRQLWSTLRTGGPLLYRSAPVGVVAVAEGEVTGRVSLRRPPADAGTVVLRGTPLELLLHAFGRERVAQVVVEGDPADVAALAGHTRAA